MPESSVELAIIECGPAGMFCYCVRAGTDRRNIFFAMDIALDALTKGGFARKDTKFIALVEPGDSAAGDNKQASEPAPIEAPRGSSSNPAFALINMEIDQVQPAIELFKWAYAGRNAREPEGCIVVCKFDGGNVEVNFQKDDLDQRLAQATAQLLRELGSLIETSDGFTAYTVGRLTLQPKGGTKAIAAHDGENNQIEPPAALDK